jgi:hypothetical protein
MRLKGENYVAMNRYEKSRVTRSRFPNLGFIGILGKRVPRALMLLLCIALIIFNIGRSLKLNHKYSLRSEISVSDFVLT